MRFRTQIQIATFMIFLFFLASPATFAQVDTIDWSNINLNYKPPKPQESYGEFVPRTQEDDGKGGTISIAGQVLTDGGLSRDLSGAKEGGTGGEITLDDDIKVANGSAGTPGINVSGGSSGTFGGFGDTGGEGGKVLQDTSSAQEDDKDISIAGRIITDGGRSADTTGGAGPQDGGTGGQIVLDPQTIHPTPPGDATSFGTPEGIGESFGFTGPIIVCGKIKKDCAIAIFDSTGACVGTVTDRQAKDNPQRTVQLLSMAEALSREDFNRNLLQGLNGGKKKILSGAFTTVEPPALTLDNQPRTLAGDHIDMLNRDKARVENELADMEKALSKMPQGGDTAAQASREFLQNNIANHRQKIAQLDQKIGEIQSNLQQGQVPAGQAPAPSGDLNQILTDLDTNVALRDNLQKQITDMEKGLSQMPAGGDSMAQAVRSGLETNLANARAELDHVNQEVSRLNSARSEFATGPGDMSILTPRERAEMTKQFAASNAPGAGLPATVVDENLLQPKTHETVLGATYQAGRDTSIGTGFERPSGGPSPNLWNTISPRLGFTYDVSGTGETRLRTQLQHQGLEVNHIDSFEPSSVMLPQLGQSQSQLDQMAGELNQGLTAKRNACNEKCFVIFIGRPRIYVIETIFGRVVLEDDPNDPLYGYKKKKEKTGGLLKTVTLGIFGGGGSSGGFAGGGISVGPAARKKGPDIKNQWGLHTIGYLPKSETESAWNVSDGSQKNVLVALIDSGLYREHPDGPKYIWFNGNEIPDNGKDDDGNGYIDDIHGWNFYNNNNDLTDLRGHGTFVSGIIAAQRNNGIGIAGINPGAEVMMLKVTDEHGNTNSLNIYRAIRYAIDQGAKIINVSLGGFGISQLEQLAINYAYAHGALVVVASGNLGENIMEHGPAAAQRAFVVGSLDYSEERSTISHVGANNGLLAPGEEIYSIHSKDAPWEGGSADRQRLYYKASGTSFAVPMVTATASLMLANNPNLTNRQIADILLASAIDLDEKGWDEKTGAGILNAAQALRMNPQDILATQITALKINRDKKKLESVDVYATVRGKDLKEFVVELGRGKSPGRFKMISGPFTREANNSWLKRIDERELRGSSDWVIKVTALNNQGKSETAQAHFSLK